MKLVGFVVEQKNVYYSNNVEEYFEWVRFSSKIYATQEIAEHAYKQSPYNNTMTSVNDEPFIGYSVAGRIVPVYRNDNEIINIT